MNAIKTVRKLRGISQAQLARESGIGRTYLSHLEGVGVVGSIGALSSIADVLGVPVWVLWFISESGDSVEDRMIRGIVDGKYLKGGQK